MRAREELGKEDFQRRMENAQKEKKRLEELLADTGDQIDKRIKFANEAFEFVERAMMKFKNGPWEKKKEILSTLGFEPLPNGQKVKYFLRKFTCADENRLTRVQ